MKLKNYTPHDVNIHLENGEKITVCPEENPIRLEEKSEEIGVLMAARPCLTYSCIPLFKKRFLSGSLPEQEDGVGLIVSLAVAQEFTERKDLFVPNEIIRDEKGRILGCKSLATFSRGIFPGKVAQY